MTRPRGHVTHLPVLDGLRALAVLLVLFAHVNPALDAWPGWLRSLRAWFDPGMQGVDLFFVLSGFLITRILLAEREHGVPLRWFLLRRALRIFPIYYLLLAVLWITRGGAELPWCAVYLSNLWFLTQENVGPLEHTWSLCVEEHFYLLWPPIVALCAPRTALRTVLFAAFPLAVATAALVLATAEPTRVLKTLCYLSPVRFLSLGIGCVLAFAEPRLAQRPRRVLALGLGSLALGVLLMPGTLVRLPVDLSGLIRPASVAAVNLSSTVLVSTGAMLCCLCAGGARLLAPLRSRPMRAIGRISYGLYLYHWPIFVGVMYANPDTPSAALAIALAFGAAALSYALIERPVLRFAARFRGGAPAAVPLPAPVPAVLPRPGAAGRDAAG